MHAIVHPGDGGCAAEANQVTQDIQEGGQRLSSARSSLAHWSSVSEASLHLKSIDNYPIPRRHCTSNIPVNQRSTQLGFISR